MNVSHRISSRQIQSIFPRCPCNSIHYIQMIKNLFCLPDAWASIDHTLSHVPCFTSFQILIRLSYPHDARTFSYFGCAQATCHADPEWLVKFSFSERSLRWEYCLCCGIHLSIIQLTNLDVAYKSMSLTRKVQSLTIAVTRGQSDTIVIKLRIMLGGNKILIYLQSCHRGQFQSLQLFWTIFIGI